MRGDSWNALGAASRGGAKQFSCADVVTLVTRGGCPCADLSLPVCSPCSAPSAAPSQTLAVPADSPRWELEGEAKVVRVPGAQVPPARRRRGGAEGLRDARRRDRRGRRDAGERAASSASSSASPTRARTASASTCAAQVGPAGRDAVHAQSSTPACNWQIYNGPGFTGAVDIPKDVWFHLRLEVAGAQARLFVKDMDKPALVMSDLKTGVQKGAGGARRPDRSDVLLELRDPRHARRAVGAAPAADAVRTR